jgi:hypothetical protein
VSDIERMFSVLATARKVAEAWLTLRVESQRTVAHHNVAPSLSVALRELARFFPAEKLTDDPRPSKTFSRPVPGESDPGAGRPATLSDVTESDLRGLTGAEIIEPRVLAGYVPLAERRCGHGKLARYNLAIHPGYCQHDDGTPCDPEWLMRPPAVSVPRELLADVQPDLGDRIFDQMREAYAGKVAEVMQVCPRCSSARWVSVSFNEGVTRRRQCVPCGKVYGGALNNDE